MGRCILFLEGCTDKEPYREAVLGACLDGYAYDEQCEGTRAWYTYKLLSFFNDEEYFFSRVQHKLRETLCWTGNCWEFEHLFDLVLEFAKNSYAPAKELIGEIYGQLLDCLAEKQPQPFEVDYHRQWLEHVCMAGVTFGGLDAFVEIADDLGGLFWRNGMYNAQSFDQLIELADSCLGRENIVSALNAVDDESGTIADYLQSVEEYEASVYAPTEAEKKKIEKRRAKRKKRIERERDKKCNVNKILHKMKKYDNADREGDWHGIALDIVNKENTVFPIEAYMYVYTGLCACCRHSVVKAMHKRGLLTDELLQECLYDCYDETRELAEKLIKN